MILMPKQIDAIHGMYNKPVGVLYMPAHEYDSATYRDVIKAADGAGVDNIAPNNSPKELIKVINNALPLLPVL